MFCSTCGATTQPGQKFCAECGTPTSTATFAAPPSPPPPPAPTTPASTPATASITTPLSVVEQTVPTYQPTPNAWDPGLGGAWQVHHTDEQPYAPGSGHTGELPIVDPAVAPTSSAAAVVVLAVLAAAATVAGVLLDNFTIATDTNDQAFKLDDIVFNVRTALVVAALVLVVGAAFAAASRREGVGLAGGAGLAVASISALAVGWELAFLQAFRDGLLGTGRFTNEVGFYVLVGAGALGVITFLVSLGAAGYDGGLPVNPMVTALGTTSAIALALGPLIPINGTAFGDNFTSSASAATVFVWCRVGALAVLLLAGVVGFLNRRRWGLSLALGAGIVTGALWLGSLRHELSASAAVNAGVGFANPGSFDGKPHIVTTLGLIGVLLAALTGFADDARRRGAIAMVPS